MSNLFKKKQSQTGIRDTLFGDLPITQWPSETASSESEPWRSFAQARAHLSSGHTHEAVTTLQRILAMPELEPRHYLQAWHFLRENDIQPDISVAKEVLGVVVEVALSGGLDLVAAYADGSARYYNHSGSGVVWEFPDDSLDQQIEDLLKAGQAVVDQIGVWEKPRPAAPLAGEVRINMLTPSGLHFGQAPTEALAADPLGGGVISAAIKLMQSLIEKAEKQKR